MTSALSLGQIVIDAADAASIAGFWSRLLDRPLVDGANQYFAVLPPAPDGSVPALMFLAVPEPRAGKNRLHLDLVSSDQPAEVERAVALGATRIDDFEEYGTRWTTLSDPEGNVFDIGLPHG
ncbi:MAG TPA: VOC family protein [Propionibacteriaceae bacterium]|nr:VOC family protein [Propionibacteriaceae bacterium]